jgi:hypothetical protein
MNAIHGEPAHEKSDEDRGLFRSGEDGGVSIMFVRWTSSILFVLQGTPTSQYGSLRPLEKREIKCRKECDYLIIITNHFDLHPVNSLPF